MLTYRSDIDGLRALAVGGVVLFHALPAALPGGFAGVDVFFVISGYLITALLRQDLAAGQFSIRSFYVRRIRRIFPALLLMLGTVWLLGYGLLMPGELRLLGKAMVHSALFANNFMLVAQAGYFDVDAELKPLLNLWSLAVEEQFYILWPWILVLVVKWRAPGRRLAIALALGSLVWSVALSAQDPVRAFFLPHYRFWELLAGALLALYGGALPAARRASFGKWLAPLGLAAILATYFCLDGHQPYPGWRALFPVLGASGLILAGPGAQVNRLLLSNRPAVILGLISYPLYLWHWPLLSFGRILFGGLSGPLTAGVVVLSLALSWVTYRYVETPIRRGYHPALRGRRFVPAASLLLLFLAGLGGLGDATSHAEGYPKRVANDAWRALEWPQARILSEECAAAFPIAGDYCQRWGEGPVTHVLIGDSHANHSFPGLGKVLARQGGNLLQIQGPLRIDAYEKSRPNLQWLAGQPQVKAVFVAYHYGRMKQADNPFGPALERLLAELQGMGKTVAFIVDGPEFDFDPRLCTSRPPLAESLGAVRPAEDVCSESLDYLWRKRADYRAYVDGLAARYPRLVFIDAFQPFCGAGKCSALRGGTPAFRDRHHLSVQGSELAFQSPLPALP